MPELLMLAQDFKKDIVWSDWLASRKMDGIRCFWDGGVTKGLRCNLVPFANIDRQGSQRISTGLWTRYGKPIHCPDWFTAGWPEYPLDGELSFDRDDLQRLKSIVKDYVPGPEWSEVKYYIFDSPPWDSFRAAKPSWKVRHLVIPEPKSVRIIDGEFYKVYPFLKTLAGPTIVPLEQHEVANRSELDSRFDAIIAEQGEGVMLRHKRSIWWPRRSDKLLKVKMVYDGVANVIGYNEGTGKYVGMIGSLICEGGFSVGSGLTDEQRKGVLPKKIRYKFKGYTDSGLPREPRLDCILE